MASIEDLKAFSLFQNMHDEQVEALKSISTITSLLSKDKVLDQEDESEDLFLILSGRVAISMPGADGEGKELARLQKGAVIGDLAFIRSASRAAEVTALMAVTLMRFKADKLRQTLESNPALGFRFMSNMATILAERLIDTDYMWRNNI